MAPNYTVLLLLLSLLLVAIATAYVPPLPPAPQRQKPLVPVVPKAPAPPVKAYTPPPKAPAPPVKAYTPPPKAPSPPVGKPPGPPSPSPYYGQGPAVKKQECLPLCEKRCALQKRKGLCLRACSTCCVRCKCVPPGTYGHQEVCGSCYSDMTTHGGKLKCP